jgi:hypothetical protein
MSLSPIRRRSCLKPFAIADALPKAPPMRMWLDDQRAYSLNEVAINWNAPLVFLLAAATSKLT